MLFLSGCSPSKMLSSEGSPIERIYIEPNFCKKKGLLYYKYNPNRNDISNQWV